MAHAAIAFAKAKFRRQMMACTTSIGPGALNMVTAAALAHSRVKLDGVEWVYIPDDNTRMLKLQAGEVDAAIFVPFNQIDTLGHGQVANSFIPAGALYHNDDNPTCPFRNAARAYVKGFYQNPTGRFMLEDTDIVK